MCLPPPAARYYLRAFLPFLEIVHNAESTCLLPLDFCSYASSGRNTTLAVCITVLTTFAQVKTRPDPSTRPSPPRGSRGGGVDGL